MENKERSYGGFVINGFTMVVASFILIAVIFLAFITLGGLSENTVIPAVVISVVYLICTVGGYFVQEPNEVRTLLFFGKYRGTFRGDGFYWINPLMTTKKISVRLSNMDIAPIKVNDKMGNPVLIGMVLVWMVKDTYRAMFDIASITLEAFVRTQSDAALREVTGRFAYDNNESPDQITLRGGGAEINHMLVEKINERLHMAGIEVVEARINYLAYAPEIAAVMLRRQQAAAIISAREKIVEGAVSMVKLAVEGLENEGVVKLDNDRKASLVSNLLVVLCADEPAQPVISAATPK
ncbi:MAG: SPFH domain-containing protein [Muribaculaceae bacterium]|nr:SPFH domain-containing protein [Muribaculaceae bacterium]